MTLTNDTSSTLRHAARQKYRQQVIFAKGDKVTSFTIHPAILAIGTCLCFLLTIGYIGATGYLVLRDDLMNTSNLEQAKLKQAYEDRLAAMRIEIDRITSRQMLDQRTVENKLNRLLGLKEAVDDRNKTLQTIVAAAGRVGITVSDIAPHPKARPDRSQKGQKPIIDYSPVTASSAYAGTKKDTNPFDRALNRTGSVPSSPFPAPRREVPAIELENLEDDIREDERAQLFKIQRLTRKTAEIADKIHDAVRQIGFKISTEKPSKGENVGGPFIDIDTLNSLEFDESILNFEENLAYLNSVKRKARSFPIGRPLKKGSISSSFGRRIDPFLGRTAFHAGLDFKASRGTSVYATGPGKVKTAGWSGGYGRMVEIQHVGGIVTRYAHLQRIDIKAGDPVRAGQKIGRVGSSGRSTGPHLHYETRYNNKPRNPIKFIKAGQDIAAYF